MGEAADPLSSIHNQQFAKERQDWLDLYRSACQDIGGKRWRENDREQLLAKVENQLWEAMRAKGMHHMTFRRKCQMAREALSRNANFNSTNER
jgi:hypothetical protein